MDVKQEQIRDLELFAGCRPRDVDWLARNADTLDVDAGCTIAQEGSRVREFIVLVDGLVGGTGDHTDVLFGPGSYFGEMGLLDGRSHPMTVTTLAPTRLLVFDPRDFRGMLEQMPGVARKLMKELVTKLREADQSMRILRAVS